VYVIYPHGNTSELEVYCDMETDGGVVTHHTVLFVSVFFRSKLLVVTREGTILEGDIEKFSEVDLSNLQVKVEVKINVTEILTVTMAK
jgi:hypothetical protein